MRNRVLKSMQVVLSLVPVVVFALSAAAATVPRISKETLKGMLDNPEVVVVDARSGSDWRGSEYKIQGAVRVPAGQVDSWAKKYPRDQTLVFYCA